MGIPMAGVARAERSRAIWVAMTGPAPLILHVFPTFAVGGAQIRFAMLANAMGSAFRHQVLSLDGRLEARERLLPSVDVTYPELVGAKNAFLASALAYRRLLRAWQPDILMTYNWGAIEFAYANLLPLVRHIHVIDGFGSDEYFTRLRRRVIANRIALASSTTVVPSMNLRRILTDEWGLPAERIRYIPNGIDLTRFPVRPRPDDTRPLVIGTVAALRPEKNIARLIFAFARLPPPVRLAIVGDGECRAELTNLARALSVEDRVDFLGHSNEIPAHLARFDIFALSSDTEQMPIVVLEAMAASLPIVSTDVGDVRPMVAPDNVALVTRDGIDGLTTHLSHLIANPGLRARLGAANRAKAERDFDQAGMFAAWQALLEDGAQPRGTHSGL